MAAQLLEGRPLAKKIRENLKEELNEIKEKYKITPHLTAVQVGENEASQVYLNQQRKSCEKMGIEYELCELKKETTQQELANFIRALNQKKEVHGIIIQLPLPSQIDPRAMREVISPFKDVEGMHPQNMGLVTYGQPKLAPCTALAAFELIKSTGRELYGQEVVVVGHSDIVGKPIGLLLLDKFATLTICHIGTKDTSIHIKRADILIVAVGKANLVKGNLVKEGAIVIDIGINRVGDKLVGDVEFEKAKEKAAFITPVPGGVGPLTVTMLIKNTVSAVKWQLQNS